MYPGRPLGSTLWNWVGLAVLVSWSILKGSQDFLHTFSMALYHKWSVKTGFTFAIQFFMLIFDGLGGVPGNGKINDNNGAGSKIL